MRGRSGESPQPLPLLVDSSTIFDCWAIIIKWCERYAPISALSVRGPAADAELTKAQNEVLIEWPDDLIVSLQLHDGFANLCLNETKPVWRSPEAGVLFNFHPLGCLEILEEYSMWQGIEREECDPVVLRQDSACLAGSISASFHAFFLPVARSDSGDLLLIDLRDGPYRGSIAVWCLSAGESRPLPFSSFTHLVKRAAQYFVAPVVSRNAWPTPYSSGGICRWHGTVESWSQIAVE